MRIVTSVPCDSVNRQEFDIIDKIPQVGKIRSDCLLSKN